MMKDHQQQQRRLPQSLSRSKSTGSSSLAYTSTNVTTRRLNSGSACEVCRKRKTKCDGGNPCAFCAVNGIECVHRATRRKKSSLAIGSSNMTTANNNNNNSSSSSLAINTIDTRIVTTIMFNDNGNNNINDNTINDGTTGIATSPIKMLNNASNEGGGSGNNNIPKNAPSWVKQLEGPSRSNLSKQTSCPSLMVATHWSPTKTPHPPSSTSTNNNNSTSGAREVYMNTAMTNHSPGLNRRNVVHRGKEEIPSMMDQLSCRTFSAAAFVDHKTNYPIYPLSSSSAANNNRSDNTPASPLPTNTSKNTFSSFKN
ncbi:hypothetical protein INT45_006604 [Circinella minor]|uniref:Zn(2)-C6 fungal-type domain-containing protein n=1 Tax=Circinella minor TaxID=1195481 RepID=A0A8H7VRB4_9FUNG|nr:hypothetical protein INT45_006604 [Circinella minor]